VEGAIRGTSDAAGAAVQAPGIAGRRSPDEEPPGSHGDKAVSYALWVGGDAAQVESLPHSIQTLVF
jgi:hypothetical protein